MTLTFEPRIVWPSSKARTESPSRSRFGDHSLSKCIDRLEYEMERMGADVACVYSELPLSVRSGQPIQGWRRSDDHGVTVVFQRGGKEYVFAVDLWDNPYDNLHAISLSIEAIRGLERWGGGLLVDQTLSGFAALPAPKSWRDILGNVKTLASAEANYRSLAKSAHPDTGGSMGAMTELNAAIEAAREEFKK